MVALLFSADVTDVATGNTNMFGTEMTGTYFPKNPMLLRYKSLWLD